jgi:glycosyltransferase involved in cell wall biosynthesis
MDVRRVLLVAYHYPPEPASGALRMAYLAKYLPEFGWEPVVLTRNTPSPVPSERGVIRVGRQFGIERPGRSMNGRAQRCAPLKAAVKSVVFFPDGAATWIPHAFAAARAEYRRRPFDAIVTSAMPASVHVVGWMLAAYLRIPWVADYRDLWDGNPYVRDPLWRKMLLRDLERRALRRAKEITTITASLAAPLRTLHRCDVTVIPNGSDADEWSDIPFEQPDSFRIVHAGSLYDGKRSPDRLFAQIAQLRRDDADFSREIRLNFYGPLAGNLLDLAARYGLDDALVYHGVVARRQAMQAERSAALLVVIQNGDPQTAHEYGSKIFEYEAAARPILAIGPPASVLRSYIAEKKLGWFASSDAEILGALRKAYDAYRSQAAFVPAAPREARAIAADFARVLA